MLTLEVTPDPVELCDGNPEASSTTRKDDGINRTGGRTADDRKRIGSAVRKHVCYRSQHPDLERPARSPARQYQPGSHPARLYIHNR